MWLKIMPEMQQVQILKKQNPVPMSQIVPVKVSQKSQMFTYPFDCAIVISKSCFFLITRIIFSHRRSEQFWKPITISVLKKII
jgi:hypothetical protein